MAKIVDPDDIYVTTASCLMGVMFKMRNSLDVEWMNVVSLGSFSSDGVESDGSTVHIDTGTRKMMVFRNGEWWEITGPES